MDNTFFSFPPFISRSFFTQVRPLNAEDFLSTLVFLLTIITFFHFILVFRSTETPVALTMLILTPSTSCSCGGVLGGVGVFFYER